MHDPVWICKYNRAIDCGVAIPNCDACGWNPFNVSLKCIRILKVLGVNRYVNAILLQIITLLFWIRIFKAGGRHGD